MSGLLWPLLLKSRRVWGWFVPKTFQGLHFLFSWSLSWRTAFWVICSWNEFEEREQCAPDQRHVKKQPPSLQITSNFLVFYGLSHSKKKDVPVFLGQDQIGPAPTPVFGIKIVQFLLQVPILLLRGHFWLVSKAFIDTSWQVAPYNFGDNF